MNNNITKTKGLKMDPWNTPEEIVRQSELIRLLLYLFAYKPGDFSNKLN